MATVNRTWGGQAGMPQVAGITQSQDVSGSTSESTGTQKTGTSSQTQNQVQTQNQAVNLSNMPAQSLAALQALIAQLSDRPALGEAEVKAMLQQRGIVQPTMRYFDRGFSTPMGGSRNGWEYLDEQGKVVDFAAYQQAQQRYVAAFTEAQAAGGIIRGGTAETKAASEARNTELATLRTAREGYTKADAFADAEALNAKAMRQMLEQILPSINTAIESSGTSGGAVAGLLKQDAAARAAENAASLGLDAAVKYGGITNDLNRTIAGLLENNTPALEGLLQALDIAKGSVQQGGTSTVTATTGTTTGATSESASSTGAKSTAQAGRNNTLQVGTNLDALVQALAGTTGTKDRFSGFTDLGSK